MHLIKTTRLIIREAELQDANFIMELLNTPSWIEYIGDRGINTILDAEDYITNKLVGSYKKNGFGLFIMELAGKKQQIGLCGLIQRDYLDAPDIGFAILPSYEGLGYTNEAATSVIHYAQYHLKLNVIYGITTENNIKSQQLLTRLGLGYDRNITSDKENEIFMLYKLEYLT